MKFKHFYILFLLTFTSIALNAQFECASAIEVTLNEDGEGEILASDLVPNIEFFLSNGTLTYFVAPLISGVIESAGDIISIDCSSAWANTFIVEYTQGDELIANCDGSLIIFDPLNGCPNYTNFCEEGSYSCGSSLAGYSVFKSDFDAIPAEDFAFCSESLNCPGDYLIAIGALEDAATLDYSTHINSADIEDYITRLVISYTENGVTEYDKSTLYVWQNLSCFLIPRASTTIDMDLTAESTLTPGMFLASENTCTQVTMAVTEINGDEPVDFFESVTLNCNDLGYHTVYLKDSETGFTARCQLFLADPLEVCGPILGPGDKLISMSNNPPVGTYAGTVVSLNGVPLQSSTTGKGWIINEDMLAEGTNTLDFDSGSFSLNGVSTLDLVRLLRLIISDEYDNPIQSIVMDVDASGYNGITDLVTIRELVLGEEVSPEPVNVLFKPEELVFPSDFDPFNFDYDFTTYEFEKSNFENLTFMFESYKVGDFNGTAVTEEGLKSGDISTTRDFDVFEVSDIEVEAGVPFTFSLSYDSGVQIKGLLTALVSNGVKFESMTANPSEDVDYNIIEDNEIRISYISPSLNADVDKITFEISAVSDNSGALIDLLSLKEGFPQEVINGDDEVIEIENIEESGVTSISETDLESSALEVYPNPVHQKLHLSNTGGMLGKIEVMDPMGKRVLMQYSDSNEMDLDVSQLANGIYYLKVENESGSVNQSFIKL
ncbi:MAG: T9SS type A sorting domain-containing protein [Bacteroidota bacterium]